MTPGLTGTSDKTDGERLRVCQHGYFTADVRTVAELEQWFPLADLEEDALAWHGPARTGPPAWLGMPGSSQFHVEIVTGFTGLHMLPVVCVLSTSTVPASDPV